MDHNSVLAYGPNMDILWFWILLYQYVDQYNKKIARETITSPELPDIEVTVQINQQAATIAFCLFTYMLFGYLLTSYYQSRSLEGLSYKYHFMV